MVNREWQLVDYDWDPNTGVAVMVYERIREDTGEVQEKKIAKEQKTWFTPGLKMRI